MTTLAVASAGGHLQELVDLLPRLGQHPDMVLATYDVEQARTLVPGYIPVHHPTTKHLPNAVRNYRLARRIIREHEPSLVISTGAAVAVPFIVRAHRLGIPCHYIESATRVSGPSLTGRMLQRLRGVHLYRQLGSWGDPRWQQGPCVFDGFRIGPTERRPLKRVVVSLGTHGYPFTRLVRQLANCFRGSGINVFWQLGSTPDPGDLPGTVQATVPSDLLAARIADADAVVGHAGVGIALTALRAGKVPILAPRRRTHREHTDDHQAELADELGNRGLALDTNADNVGLDLMRETTERRVTFEVPTPFMLSR